MVLWKKKSEAVPQAAPKRRGSRTPLELKLAALDGHAQGLRNGYAH